MNKPRDDFETIMERVDYLLADYEQGINELAHWMACWRERQRAAATATTSSPNQDTQNGNAGSSMNVIRKSNAGI